MRVFRILMVVGVAALLWSGCDDQTSVSPSSGVVDTLHGPLDNFEAEAVAVHLSRKLVAPLDMYDRVEHSLQNIRELFGDSIPAVAIQYQLPWTLGRFTAKVDTNLMRDSSSTTFKVFDSLNQIYGMTETRHMFLNFHSVTFANRYNPVRLIEIYSVVPGFEIMETSGHVGDGSDLYIQLRDVEPSNYFFRDAWGDCMSGCIYSQIHCISENEGEYTYHGFYGPAYTDTLPPKPPWLDDCIDAWRAKDYGITWYPDSVIYW